MKMSLQHHAHWLTPVIFLLFLQSFLLVSGDPLNFIVVDPISGNDSSCQSILIDSTTTADAALAPCQSIDRAIVMLEGTANGANSFWLHMRPATYWVSTVLVPLPFLTFSIYLPPLPTATNYSFPPTLTTNTSRVTWNCLNSPNCIRSSLPGLTIEGVAFRNVSLHAVHHIGSTETQLSTADLTMYQVDCRDSGGLLYKVNGSVSLSQVELVNATNSPNALGFQSSVSLVHFVNSNVTIADSSFRHCQINGSFKYPSSVMSVVSQSDLTSFRMFRTAFRNNVFESNTPSSFGGTANCGIGPGIIFNVSFITIQVDACDIANNFGSSEVAKVCGSGLAVFPFADPNPSHTVNVQISSSRFWNNSIFTTWTSDGLGILVSYSEAATAPFITIRNCTFFNHSVDNYFDGAIVGLHRTLKASIIDSYFFDNAVRAFKYLDDGLNIGSILIDRTQFDRNTNPTVQIAVLQDVTFQNSLFRNGIGYVEAGAVVLFKSGLGTANPTVTIDNCAFVSNHGGTGGALSLQQLTAVISNTNFTDNFSHLGGGARFLSSTVKLKHCIFSNNYVVSDFFDLKSTYPASGGAIYAAKSTVSADDSTFINSTFQSPDGVQACGSVSQGTIVSASPRGGAFGLSQTELTLTDCSIVGSYACIGGDIYANGESIYLIDTIFSNSRAMLGGSVAMREADTFFGFSVGFVNVSSISDGGALIFTTVNQVRVSYSLFDRVQSVTGDGGVFHLSLMSPWAGISADGLEFRNCSAPNGGGLAFFSSIDGGALLTFGLDDENNWNTIIPPDEQQYVQWGEVEATNAVSITSSVDFVSLYPGQHFSQTQLAEPFNISILALDGFNQTIRGDRGMVIHCALLDVDGQSTRKATLSGTVLQQMTGTLDAAVFDDLFIVGEPGEYQLVFSVVGALYIPHIIVPALLRPDCPSSLFYKNGICTSCPNSLLVYDPIANDCVACDIGRVATSDGKCAICDLGLTNYGSPTCAQCSSNTYQPAPLVSCTSCVGDEMNGITCNNGLAEVLPGYFAFNVFLNGSSTPSIRTVQCPVGYCDSGAPLQSNWSDPQIHLINGSASTVVPYFASAVTRFDQCAYPRLASEDNYLCGACAPGLIVWGDRCSKCDQADGGLMFLFIFLSFALVIFLVRASLASASAGHTTILLYFIQTAMLEIGPSSNLIGWMKIGLLSPTSFSNCVAPLDVYQQSTFQLLMPLFLLGELLIVMFFHYVWFRFRSQGGAGSSRPESSTGQRQSLSQSALALRSRFLSIIDSFSIDLYISASLSILLFTYTQVMMESFRMLACVDVAGVQVVFTQPTMRCDSQEYKRHMVLVGFVVAYVGMLPLSISLFIWRNNTLVQMSHDLMKFEDPSYDVTMALESAPSSHRKSMEISVPRPDRKLVSRFLLRYSAIFSMYSARAWFFKGVLLSRRIVFAAISVSLVRRPNMQFFAFSFAHVLSSLLQGYVRPFERDFFNWMEIASHVVLLLLSQSLTAVLPPYGRGTQVYLFCIIIVPVCIYALLALIEGYLSHRKLRSMEQIMFSRGSIEAMAGLSEKPTNVSHHELQQSQSIELHEINGNPSSNLGESTVEINQINQSSTVSQPHDQSDAMIDASNSSESQQVLPQDVKRSEAILHEDSAAL